MVLVGGAAAVFVSLCGFLSEQLAEIFLIMKCIFQGLDHRITEGGGALSLCVCVCVCVVVFSSFSKATPNHSPRPHHHCLRVVAGSCTAPPPPPPP